MEDAQAQEFRHILESMRRTTAALREADVPFALGGSVACWARGGPETCNDVDLLVATADSERATQVLRDLGLRIEDPPEHWLIKAWDGDVLVDLICELTGVGDTAGPIARAETMRVAAMELPVARMEDVMTAKLLALDEHNLDLSGPLRIVRATREQIDWHELRSRTCHSPYARGFFAMIDALDLTQSAPASAPAPGAVRVRPVTEVPGAAS